VRAREGIFFGPELPDADDEWAEKGLPTVLSIGGGCFITDRFGFGTLFRIEPSAGLYWSMRLVDADTEELVVDPPPQMNRDGVVVYIRRQKQTQLHTLVRAQLVPETEPNRKEYFVPEIRPGHRRRFLRDNLVAGPATRTRVEWDDGTPFKWRNPGWGWLSECIASSQGGACGATLGSGAESPWDSPAGMGASLPELFGVRATRPLNGPKKSAKLQRIPLGFPAPPRGAAASLFRPSAVQCR
jgi:hypothetical protein